MKVPEDIGFNDIKTYPWISRQNPTTYATSLDAYGLNKRSNGCVLSIEKGALFFRDAFKRCIIRDMSTDVF